ncbi:Zn(2+)-responsive transcriptional regulator [soil metagenome]
MVGYSIGEVTDLAGVSRDTLRYYEKIGLLKPVARSAAGHRRYGSHDLERLRFIGRGQKMNFRLAEIATLLKFRDNPAQSRESVRSIAAAKLEEVENHVEELNHLRGELQLLLNLCAGADGHCPILESLDGGSATARIRQ